MDSDRLLDDIAELKQGSRASLAMVAAGIVFLLGSISYSTYNLWPLKRQVRELQVNIEKLEAKKAELTGFAAAVDAAAKPVPNAQSEKIGWVYVGRVSSTGNWAPKSDRIATPGTPGQITPGSTVTTQSNAALVDDIDSNSGAAPPARAEADKPRLFIRPGTTLTVAEVQEQASISGGKFVWIKTRVTSGDLLSLEAPPS